MTLFKEVVLAGGALCCVLFALNISTPQVPSPEQGVTDQTIVRIAAAPGSQVEHGAGELLVGSPPALDETRSSEAETAAVAAPVTGQAFASFENGREQKRERSKWAAAARRLSPKSTHARVATAQSAFSPTWNDNSWSWNQSWQGQSAKAFRSSLARQSPRRSPGYVSWNSLSFYRQ
jgi:hypothetical protein